MGDSVVVGGAKTAEGPIVMGDEIPASRATTKLAACSV
jgi:hypothetical protein